MALGAWGKNQSKIATMTIRQYHQQHSLRDEEDLFHSSLSAEFNNDSTDNGRRPWLPTAGRQASAPFKSSEDVPPADLYGARHDVYMPISANDVRSASGRNEKNLFPDGLLPGDRSNITDQSDAHDFEITGAVFPHYADDIEGGETKCAIDGQSHSPLEDDELYPSDNNDVFVGYCEDSYDDIMKDSHEYDLDMTGDDDDYHSNMQYSELTTANAGTLRENRYPIDDAYSSMNEVEGQIRYERKVLWYDEVNKESDHMAISASGSDSELSTYQPMHCHSPHYEQNKYYEDEQTSSHYSDGNKSYGTFDRLYDEEYSIIYSTPAEASEISMENYTSSSYSSPTQKKLQSLLPSLSPDHSPDSVLDTPGSYLGEIYQSTNDETKLTENECNRVEIPVVGNSKSGGMSEEPDPPHAGMEIETTPVVADSTRQNWNNDVTTIGTEDTGIPDIADSPKSYTSRNVSSAENSSDEDSAIRHLQSFHQQDQVPQDDVHGQQPSNEEICSSQLDTGVGQMSRHQKLQEQRQRSRIIADLRLQNSHCSIPRRKNYRPKLEPGDVEPLEPLGVRYYGSEEENELFPDIAWDKNGNIIEEKRESNRKMKIVPAPIKSPSQDNKNDCFDIGNDSMLSCVTQRIKTSSSRRAEPDNRVHVIGHNHIHRHVENKQRADDTRLLEPSVGAEESMDESVRFSDDVSVISDATELRHLTQQHMKKELHRLHPYSVKPKDSMESMSLDFDENEDKEKIYIHIKRVDSMENDMMIIDFEVGSPPTKPKMDNCTLDNHDVRAVQPDEESRRSLISPPALRRQQLSFPPKNEGEEEGSVFSLKSYSNDSDATNDPAIFPSRAVYQMNLGMLKNNNKEWGEHDNLVEKACEFLARGRNDDALRALNQALDDAQEQMDNVKDLMDEHYYQKERRLRSPTSEQLLTEEEYEEKMDADFRHAASEMADVLNNIGVVHEMNGDYHLALNTFRDALDVYRRMCHRYENAGDADVDRTVTNIMHMGIALRSREKREELHDEADELAALVDDSNNNKDRMELQMEMMDVLMCLIEMEQESLGRNHPSVGFTLLSKGKLHLDMKHVEMAAKDIQEAVTILQNGLGRSHPAVGNALLVLADMFNYHGLGDPIADKNAALEIYRQAIDPLTGSNGDMSPDLGRAHNSIGIICSGKGDMELALQSFYKSLACYGVREKGDSASKGKTHPDVVYIWLNVGDLHMEQNEWRLGLRSYLKAHSALRSLGEEDMVSFHETSQKRMKTAHMRSGGSAVEDHQAFLASVLLSIGKAQSVLHQYGKSIEIFEEALRIHRAINMRCKGGSSVDAGKDVARILQNLGEVHMASGNMTSASNCYIESLNLLRSIHDTNNDNNIEVALVLAAIGNTHLKKCEYAEATVVLKECMRALEKSGVPPNNRKYKDIRSSLVDAELAVMQNTLSTLASQRRELSILEYQDKALACDAIADSYKNKGDTSEAIWFYSEALVIRREKLKRTSGGLKESESVDIGRTLSSIAQLRLKRREFQAAKILFDEVRQAYNQVGLSKDHPYYKDLLGQIEAMRKS